LGGNTVARGSGAGGALDSAFMMLTAGMELADG
jgi:hypothetical protein